MSKFFDYTEETGLLYTTDHNNETDGTIIHTKGDCSPVLERALQIRNDGRNDSKGIKEDWWLYATIPPAIEVVLKGRGISIYKKEDQKVAQP